MDDVGTALTDVEDRSGQLNVTKMTRTDANVLFARRARVHAVNGAELRIIETLLTGLRIGLVHGLRVDDVHDGHGLDLLGRQQAELDLLDGPERTFRLDGRTWRHGGGGGRESRWCWGRRFCLSLCRHRARRGGSPSGTSLRDLGRAKVCRGSGCCCCALVVGGRRCAAGAVCDAGEE